MGASNIKEDVWIPTTCNMCFCGCHIKVHRVDGVVVKIEGNPDSPVGEGRVCAKGHAGIMQLYDPYRQTKPMLRTNPEKGISIDPEWKEISWDEAMDLLAGKIGAAVQEDPRKVMYYSIVANLTGNLLLASFFGGILQAPTHMSDICGTSIHTLYDLHSGTGNCCPDYNRTKYLLQFGVQAGTATRHGFNMTIRRFADARVDNGMKLVVIDPHMSASAEKADHWLPIRPGTDAALALSIANVLVNELGIYDAEYLKKYTNAPYLVNPKTGRFIRDEASNKPYVWDSEEGAAKIFSDSSIKDFALLGTYTVNGVEVKPGFQILKEHLAKYTPEFAEGVTTIPAKNIRMVAKEFGEAASIGSTITIDGKQMPYRPVAADAFSGISRHRHGFLSHWSILLLNVLVGAYNVPGGYVGFGPAKHPVPETGKISWWPDVWEEDGMLNYVTLGFPMPASYYQKIREQIKDTGDLAMKGLMPLIEFDTHFNYPNQVYPERLKRPVQADVLFIYGGNPLKNWGNHDEMAQWFKAFDFVVSCDLYLNDSSYFADLFLPEACYLERLEALPNQYFNHHTIGGLDVPWTWAIRQPVVPPRDGVWSNSQILLELAERLQMRPYVYGLLGIMFNLDPEYSLDPAQKYTWEEIADRIYKANFGETHGLEVMKRDGVIKHPRTVDEVYMILTLEEKKARIPLYFDFMLEAKEKIDKEAESLGISWDTSDYQPLPDWKPCVEYEVTDPEYDLLPTYYTAAHQVDTWGLCNPWQRELAELDPYTNHIEINTETARRKGLSDGDEVMLESTHGAKVFGKIRVTEGVHPECLAVNGGCMNSQSEYMPMHKGRGVAINHLNPAMDLKYYDHISAAFDQCVRVRISKV